MASRISQGPDGSGNGHRWVRGSRFMRSMMMSMQRALSEDVIRSSGSSSSSRLLAAPPRPVRRSTRATKSGYTRRNTRWRGQVLVPLDRALGAWRK
eukprot:1130012-Pyramimonas_sp.AAC.1